MLKASSPWNQNPFNVQSSPLSADDMMKLASGFATPTSVQQPQPKGATQMAMATSGKKNTTGTGAVTPTLGTGKVATNPPAGKNGTYKDAYSAPHQAGGTAPAAGKKAPAKKPGQKPANAADGPVDAGTLQPGGKKGGGKRFTSIKELRDYANKQGYGN